MQEYARYYHDIEYEDLTPHIGKIHSVANFLCIPHADPTSYSIEKLIELGAII